MLETITISGIDDTAEPADLAEVSRHFDVEWGILLGPRDWMGRKPRFPSIDWLERLVRWASGSVSMKLSGHLCGPPAAWLVAGMYSPIRDYRFLWKHLGRAQVNTARRQTGRLHPLAAGEMIALGQEWIFQQDGVNDRLLDEALALGVKARGLNDLSGGRGKTPAGWPRADDARTGYAGGLGLVNIRHQLPLIADAAGNRPFWIDMESGVRTNNKFDLSKVLDILSLVENHKVPPERKSDVGQEVRLATVS